MNSSPRHESGTIADQKPDGSDVKGDCYSAGERSWMEYGQQLRAYWLGPFLKLMTAARITPDHLTLVSLILGLAFLPTWLLERPILAIILLWLHVAMDGLDGPLARFQNCASPRGSFTDSFCDQIVVSAVTISLMMKPPGVSIAAGSTFLVAYVGVLAISMVRNTLQIPYSWLLRPRLIVYAMIPVQLVVTANLLEPLMWACNAVMALKLMTGFLKLRRKLSGPDEDSP